MNIKKILAIVIIVLAVFSCLSIASAGFFDFLSGEKFLEGDNTQVKVPSNYTVDDKKMVASCNGINISFVAQKSTDNKFESDFFAAIKENGKEAGYENVTNRTVNGYTIYDFADKTALSAISKFLFSTIRPTKHTFNLPLIFSILPLCFGKAGTLGNK